MASARRLLKTLKTSHSVPRVTVLGAGYWGQNLIRNFYDLQALAAICDCNPARFRNFRNKYQSCRFTTSYREILSDPTLHAVVIATPAENHDVIVEETIVAGKDVFVEKPLSLSVERANALVKLARDQGVMMYRGRPSW